MNSTVSTTPEDITHDVILRSAVERQLEIAGEAGRRLADYDEAVAKTLPGLRAVIGTRNIIAHQYDRIDWARMFETIDGPLTNLDVAVSRLLNEIGPPGADE